MQAPGISVSSAKKRITTVWFITMGLIFCSIFVAIATAAHNDCEKEYCSKSKGFAAVWNVLVAVAVMYYGTRTFRHAKTEENLGCLIGVLFVMAYNLFMQFVLFVGLAKEAKDSGHEAHADNAAAAFTFFLSVAYAVLTVLIYRARDEITGVPYGEHVGDVGGGPVARPAPAANIGGVDERAIELATQAGTA